MISVKQILLGGMLAVAIMAIAPSARALRTTKRTFVSEVLNILAAALALGLAFTTVRAADLTPAETKAIAEERFIYGLPIVMNYTVMYGYAVDRSKSING